MGGPRRFISGEEAVEAVLPVLHLRKPLDSSCTSKSSSSNNTSMEPIDGVKASCVSGTKLKLTSSSTTGRSSDASSSSNRNNSNSSSNTPSSTRSTDTPSSNSSGSTSPISESLSPVRSRTRSSNASSSSISSSSSTSSSSTSSSSTSSSSTSSSSTSSSSTSSSSTSSSSTSSSSRRNIHRGGLLLQHASSGSKTETEAVQHEGGVLLQRQQQPTPILRLSVNRRTGAVSRSQHPAGHSSRSSLTLAPARLRLGSSSRNSSSSSSTVYLQHADYREQIETAENGNLKWGQKEANDGSWVEKWAVQTLPKPQQQQQQQQQQEEQQEQRVLEFGQSQGRNYQTNERWISRWQETERERRMEKVVQELQQQEEQQQEHQQQEQQQQQEVLQEWEEEETEDKINGILKISKRGTDSRSGEGRNWSLRLLKRKHQAAATAATRDTGEAMDDGAQGTGEDLLAESSVLLPAAAAATAAEAAANLQPGHELEVFEETRGMETRGRLQHRRTDGRLVFEATWREVAAAATATETEATTAAAKEVQQECMWIDEDGTKRGLKKGRDKDGGSWEEEWKENCDGTRESIKRRQMQHGEWEETTGVRRAAQGDNQQHLEEFSNRVERTYGDGHIVESTDSWLRPLDGSGAARGTQRRETQTFDGHKLTCVEVQQQVWEDNGDEFNSDLWTEETHIQHQGNNAVALHKNRWGRKKGNRRTDGMEWGERWEEVEGLEDTAAQQQQQQQQEQQHLRIRILLPGGEVTTRQVLLLQQQPMQIKRRYEDKWWIEASGNSWGHKEGFDEDGAKLREKWYDNGNEKEVDRWKEMPDGAMEGEKRGSRRDGTTWMERWGCGAGGEDRWVDKSWEEKENGGEVLLRWGSSSGSSKEQQKEWEQQWWEKEHWNGGSKFVEKIEKNSNGDRHTLKEGNEWKRTEHSDREVTSWFEERFGNHQETQWAVKKGGDQNGEWTEKWTEKPSEKSAEKSGWNKQGDTWEERWREKFDGDTKTETWAEKKGSNATGESWMETWEERWGWKTAHKEARDACGNRRVERWGEQFFDDGSGQKWAQHWQEENPQNNPHQGDSQGPIRSSGKSWGDRWGPNGVGGHRWGEEWGEGGCRKWAHDTPGRPEGC